MPTLNCGFTRNGLPDNYKKGNPFAQMKGAYFVARGTSFTIAQAEDIDNFTAKVIAKTLLPIHGVHNIENTSTEKTVLESATGRKKKTSDGLRGYKIYFDLTREQHEAIKGWEGAQMDIIPYDQSGYIKFTSPDGANLRGFKIDYFDVEKLPIVTSDSAELTCVEIQEDDANEWDLSGYYTQPQTNSVIADRWNPSDVLTITLITVTASAVAANACTVTLSLPTKEMKDGAIVSRAVRGVAAANIKLFTGAGVAVTTHTFVETTTPGTWALANTTLSAGYYFYYLAVSTDEKLFESATVTLAA